MPDAEVKLSEATVEALRILRTVGAPMTGGAFARKMWVEKLDHPVSSRRMHGYRRRGGAFLAQLVKRGLVDYDYSMPTYSPNAKYVISPAGLEALKRAEAS